MWPTKLLIISVDAGAKIACGRGTGNYYITSDGLILCNTVVQHEDTVDFQVLAISKTSTVRAHALTVNTK